MFKKRISILGTERKMLFLRSFSGSLALLLNVYAVSKLTLSDAMILNYTSPAFVALISMWVFREKIHPATFGFIGLALVGAAFIVKPTGHLSFWPGFLGLLSGVFAAVAYISIKQLHESESSFTIVLQFAIGTSILGAFGFSQFVLPSVGEGFGLIGIGVLGTLAQLCMTKSYSYGKASLISPFSLSAVLFASLWGAIFWGEFPDRYSVLGTLLIMACGVGLMRMGTGRTPACQSLVD